MILRISDRVAKGRRMGLDPATCWSTCRPVGEVFVFEYYSRPHGMGVGDLSTLWGNYGGYRSRALHLVNSAADFRPPAAARGGGHVKLVSGGTDGTL